MIQRINKNGSENWNNIEQKLINKRTECEPLQFGSSIERIAAGNTENPQCNTTENVERAASKDSPLTV